MNVTAEPALLRVTSIETQPFIMATDDTDKSNAASTTVHKGFVMDLMARLEAHTKFKFDMNLVKDGRYGRKNADGSWNGMVGEVLRNESDLIIAPLTATAYRLEAIDFSVPFLTTGLKVLIYRSPDEFTQQSLFIFTHVFNWETWTAVLITSLLLVSILWILQLQYPNDIAAEKTRPAAECLFVIGCRFYFFFLVSVYLIGLWHVYNAQHQTSNIKQIEQLMADKQLEFGVNVGGSTQKFLESSPTPVIKRIWQRMAPEVAANKSDLGPHMVSSYADGIARVSEKKGKFVFVMEGTAADYSSVTLPCDKEAVGPALNEVDYAIGMRKAYSHRDALDKALLTMKSNGEMIELWNVWFKHKSECDRDSTALRNMVVTTRIFSHSAWGVILFLVIVSMMSLLVIVPETLIKRTPIYERVSSIIMELKSKFPRGSNVDQSIIQDDGNQVGDGAQLTFNHS